MSFIEPDILLSWQHIESRTEQGERDYFVAGVPKHVIKPLLETLAVANIKPFMVDIKPLALARAAASEEAILISLERNYVDITVVSGGLIRIIHSFAQVSHPENTQELVNEVIKGLNKAEKSYSRDYHQDPLPTEVPILIAGELAAEDQVPQILENLSGHPVRLLSPMIEISEEIELPKYITNLGLLLKPSANKSGVESGILHYHDMNLDLLEGLRKPSAFRFKESYAFATMAFIAVAGFLAFTYTLNHGIKNEIDTLNTQSASLNQDLIQAQKTNKTTLNSKEQENQTLDTLKVSLTAMQSEHQYVENLKYDFADRIAIINECLPQGAEFESINLNGDYTSVTGSALSAESVQSYSDTLEKEQTIASAKIQTIAPIKDSSRVYFSIEIAHN
jgi:Tfp pilus assembly protein PilN